MVKQATYEDEARQFDEDLQTYVQASKKYSKQLMFEWQNEMIFSMMVEEGKTLEIGCGIGNFLVPATRSGFEVYGLEVSFETAKYVRDLILDNRLHQGVAEKLPFPDNTFHNIVARGVIHHLESPQAGLEEMCRVLHPDGKIYIFEGAPEGWYRNVSLGLADILGVQHENTHFRHLSYREIKSLLPANINAKRQWVGGLFAPFSYIGFGNEPVWNLLEPIRKALQQTIPSFFGWWNLITITKQTD